VTDAEPNDHAEDRPSLLERERERLRASRWEQTIEDRVRPRLAATAERRPALWRRVVAPSLTVAVRVSRDAVGILAGSLTYGAFLSLPPLLLILMSIGGALLRSHPQASEDLVTAVTNVVPGLDQVINANVELRSVQQLGIGLAGLVAVIWAASGFAARTRYAFGVVFRTERTGLVGGRISAALLGMPIMLLFVVLAVAGGLSAGVRLGDLPWLSEITGLAGVVLVSFLFVLLTYRLLTPGDGPSFRHHVPGAVVFALGWLVLHLLGATYVSYVIARTTALYGAVGAIFGVFAFIYLTMWMLLLGAEVSQAYRSTAADVAEVVGLPPGAEPR
jgi:membrane protein